MELNEYILRHKSLSILNAPSNKMGIEISNPPANIIDSNDNIVHLYKEIKLKIVEQDSKLLIAEFEIGLQSEVQVDSDVSFSNDEFNQLITPVLYVYVSEMINEIKFPQISFKYFSNLLMENNHE